MNIKNQLCTPAQAAQLKELGVVQSSYFYYNRGSLHQHVIFDKYPYLNPAGSCAAFSVAELIQLVGNVYGIQCDHRMPNSFYRQTKIDPANWSDQFTNYATFAEAIADKVIDCLKRGWSTAEEVNAQLLQQTPIQDNTPLEATPEDFKPVP